MELQEQVTELAEDLKKSQKLFVALGDEVRREGTRNYYYFDAGDRCEMVIQLLKKVQQIEDMVPKPNLEREW